MAEELEVRMNSVLVSGRKDKTPTYAEYVKDKDSGRTVGEDFAYHERRIGAVEETVQGTTITSVDAKVEALTTEIGEDPADLAKKYIRMVTKGRVTWWV